MTLTEVDVRAYNREAWNRRGGQGQTGGRCRWARRSSPPRAGASGAWCSPRASPCPAQWFGELKGKEVLGLASAGGQQGPVLAAAGARVTIFDNSPAQLGQDRLVAEREGLAIRLVEGDMRDLSVFPDGSFDLIFHPCSNCFVDEFAVSGARHTGCCGPEGRCCPGSATRSSSCSIRQLETGRA